MSAPEARPLAGPPVTPDYLLIGHVSVDRLGLDRFVMGGTATYAALAARNLGARVGVHTSASYEPGLVDTLYGTMVARIPAAYTTCFANTYSEDGHRQQVIESVAEKLTYDQLLPEWRKAPVVHLAPLCQEMDATLVNRFPRALIGVTPQGWMRSWDEDGRVHATGWADVDHVLKRADVVVLSNEDLPRPELLDEWVARSRLLVLTLGASGCRVYKQGEPEPYRSLAFKSGPEVDPTGAGDVFAAAYLWHLHRTGDWREAADWANCVASFVVERRGPAAVPKLEDAEKRWRRGERLLAGRGEPG